MGGGEGGGGGVKELPSRVLLLNEPENTIALFCL